MVKQHSVYLNALKSLDLEIVLLEALEEHPDAYFVEDTAVVAPDIAVITNPGAEARRGEEETIEAVLSQYRETIRIQSPGTLEGGDVLMVGNHFFIGLSERTNRDGALQLGRILERTGHTWTVIPLAAGLHLKSGFNYVGENTLLVTQDFADLDALRGFEKIIVDRAEEYAANVLLVNDHLIIPKGFPATREKLAALGLKIIELSEAKRARWTAA